MDNTFSGFGAVTTAAPTYPTGTDRPLSLDTAGNLRVSATGGGALPPGTNNIGVIGQQITVSVTPTVTAGAYTTGQIMGGIITLASILRVAGGSGYLPFIEATVKLTTFTGAIDAFIFSKLPTGTYTDNTTFNLTTTDAASLLGVRHLYDLTPSGTGPAILRDVWQAQSVYNNDTSPGTNLYVILVTRASGTLGSTSDVVLRATVDEN